MTQILNPETRAGYVASGGKLGCEYCGRSFLMKPGGFKGQIVFPFHNVARRGDRHQPMPQRCSGSGITVQVATEAQIDAEDRTAMIADMLKYSDKFGAEQLAAMPARELEQAWFDTLYAPK